jgi:transposase
VTGKTDLRKGIDGLAAVITEEFDLDSFQKNLFLFCGSRKDRFNGLLWDQDAL